MPGSIQALLKQETMVTLGKDCHKLFFNALFSLYTIILIMVVMMIVIIQMMMRIIIFVAVTGTNM